MTNTERMFFIIGGRDVNRPQPGQIVYVENGANKWKWPADITPAEKAKAAGVVFDVEGDRVTILGSGNTHTEQWSKVANYEITKIPTASGSYAVTLEGKAVGSFNYVKSSGTIAEFTTQLDAFLKDTTRADYNAVCARWEAYNNPDDGKSYLQEWNYITYESTVTIASTTLVKLIGSELAAYTTSTIHNQIGQATIYCGLNRERIEEYCSGNTSDNCNPKDKRMDGVTQLYVTYPCSLAYYAGALGDGLRANYPTYSLYLDACMAKVDKSDTGIMHYWDGREQTNLLVNKYVYRNGVKIKAYAAANYAHDYDAGVDGFRQGAWWLPSMYEMGRLMRHIKTDLSDPINVALTALGWQNVRNNVTRWAVCRCNANIAWIYYSGGISGDNNFDLAYAVLAVAAFTV